MSSEENKMNEENIDSIHVSAQVRESSLHDQLPCFFTCFSECTLGKPIYRTVWRSWRFSYIESLHLGTHRGATLVPVHKTGTTSSPLLCSKWGKWWAWLIGRNKSLLFRSSSWSRGAILKLGIWPQFIFPGCDFTLTTMSCQPLLLVTYMIQQNLISIF